MANMACARFGHVTRLLVTCGRAGAGAGAVRKAHLPPDPGREGRESSHGPSLQKGRSFFWNLFWGPRLRRGCIASLQQRRRDVEVAGAERNLFVAPTPNGTRGTATLPLSQLSLAFTD
jgi:hypothetical protein